MGITIRNITKYNMFENAGDLTLSDSMVHGLIAILFYSQHYMEISELDLNKLAQVPEAV